MAMRQPKSAKHANRPAGKVGYLDGQLLIAMPHMQDERFKNSVIYLCAHSSDGAMGIVINQPAEDMSFSGLLRQLEIVDESDSIRFPGALERIPVLKGGPVEVGRGFVLHSADYFADSATLPIASNISLTATLDVLRAIADGQGPQTAMLALGYAGWGAGQLEKEMLGNGWLHCPADPDLVFATPFEKRYQAALTRLGINPLFLSAESGHA
jgi:putative transcriptional regulator